MLSPVISEARAKGCKAHALSHRVPAVRVQADASGPPAQPRRRCWSGHGWIVASDCFRWSTNALAIIGSCVPSISNSFNNRSRVCFGQPPVHTESTAVSADHGEEDLMAEELRHDDGVELLIAGAAAGRGYAFGGRPGLDGGVSSKSMVNHLGPLHSEVDFTPKSTHPKGWADTLSRRKAIE